MKAPTSVEPMSQRMTVTFPYKHSTGEVTGRFLAGLKEQKKITQVLPSYTAFVDPSFLQTAIASN